MEKSTLSLTSVRFYPDNESEDDDALSRVATEIFSLSLATQVEVEALCKKQGVPAEFAAPPAGERHAGTPPLPGAVCVYAHALEVGLRFPLHAFCREAISHPPTSLCLRRN